MRALDAERAAERADAPVGTILDGRPPITWPTQETQPPSTACLSTLHTAAPTPWDPDECPECGTTTPAGARRDVKRKTHR